jgi:hypothetical protein
MSSAKNSILFFRRFKIQEQNSETDIVKDSSKSWALKFDLPSNYSRETCRIEIFHDFWAGLDYSIERTGDSAGKKGNLLDIITKRSSNPTPK